MANYLDLAGLTAYDTKIKAWFNAGIADITSDAINGLFVTPISYQMVDLGLPSGLKWADRNVGAETPQDNGLYFSWGNVDGHAIDEEGNVVDGYSFDKNSYITTPGGQYTGMLLDAEHDAATANVGSDWRMPTIDETTELIQNTDHYFIGEDGNIVAGPFNIPVNSANNVLDGSKLRSICFVKKGETFDYNNRSNFIEFPFAGRCYISPSALDSKGERAHIWMRSTSTTKYNANDLSLSSFGYISCGKSIIMDSYAGVSIRGVHE